MRFAMLAFAVVVAAGCSSEPKAGQKTAERTPRYFELEDVKVTVAAFDKKLAAFEVPAEVKAASPGNRPTVAVSGVTNNSAGHVNGEIVADDLSTVLTESRKFQVIEDHERSGRDIGLSVGPPPDTRFKVETTLADKPDGTLVSTVVLRDARSGKALLESVCEFPPRSAR